MKRIVDYVLLELGFLIISFASVFARCASSQDSTLGFIIFLGLEVLFLGIYALLWQQILKRFSLMVAMANKGVTIVYSLFWAFFLFGEKVSIINIFGSAIVIFGIILVASDD